MALRLCVLRESDILTVCMSVGPASVALKFAATPLLSQYGVRSMTTEPSRRQQGPCGCQQEVRKAYP